MDVFGVADENGLTGPSTPVVSIPQARVKVVPNLEPATQTVSNFSVKRSSQNGQDRRKYSHDDHDYHPHHIHGHYLSTPNSSNSSNNMSTNSSTRADVTTSTLTLCLGLVFTSLAAVALVTIVLISLRRRRMRRRAARMEQSQWICHRAVPSRTKADGWLYSMITFDYDQEKIAAIREEEKGEWV